MQKSQKDNWLLMLTSAFYVLIKHYNQLRSPQKNVLFDIYKTNAFRIFKKIIQQQI